MQPGCVVLAVVIQLLLSTAQAEQYETSTGQRRNNHNRVARHEARLRAVQSNAQGTAYRQSQAAAAMANAADWTRLDESKEHWTGRNETLPDPGTSAQTPQLELVVARSIEKLDWLAKVPVMWQVTVLNRGSNMESWISETRGHVQIKSLPGARSDSELFAAFLVDRYYSLAEYTVFSPAKPLQYNWRFLDLLQSPTKFGTVQALAGQSTQRGAKMKTDRISTRTLNSVMIHNPESVDTAKWFSKDYNLTWGQNLVKKYFDMIGLEDWMDERQEVGSHAMGVMVGFERSRAARHSKQIYEKLYRSIPQFGGNHHVVDKLWLMIFGGSDFTDTLL